MIVLLSALCRAGEEPKDPGAAADPEPAPDPAPAPAPAADPAPALTADHLVWDGQLLRVQGGTWRTDTLGRIAFDEGTLDPEAGHLDATQVRWEPCACPGVQPYAFEAKHLVADPEDVWVRGGRLRVVGVPVPLPGMRVPLTRRSGFLAPTAGWGTDGLLLRTPLYLATSPSTDLTLTPELRSSRSLRMLTEGRLATRGGTAQAEIWGGRDWSRESWRGAASLDMGLVHGPARLATDLRAVSDLDVLRDYADAFLDRQSPWVTSRATASMGPFSLEHASVQHVEPALQRVARVALRRSGEVDGWVWLGTARSTWAGPALRTWEVEDLTAVHDGAIRVSRPSMVGPLLVEPVLSARAGGASADASFGARDPVAGAPFGADSSFGADAGLGVETRLLAWRRTEAAAERLEPTLGLGVGADELGLGPLVRPGVEYRRIGARSVADLGAEVGLAKAGSPDWLGRARLERGASSLWAHAAGRLAPDLLAAGARLDVDPVSIGAGWMWADDALVYGGAGYHRALGDARLRIRTWTLSGGVTGGIETGVDSGRAGIEYEHPSGCLSAGVTGQLATDRRDVALVLRVLP